MTTKSFLQKRQEKGNAVQVSSPAERKKTSRPARLFRKRYLLIPLILVSLFLLPGPVLLVSRPEISEGDVASVRIRVVNVGFGSVRVLMVSPSHPHVLMESDTEGLRSTWADSRYYFRWGRYGDAIPPFCTRMFSVRVRPPDGGWRIGLMFSPCNEISPFPVCSSRIRAIELHHLDFSELAHHPFPELAESPPAPHLLANEDGTVGNDFLVFGNGPFGSAFEFLDHVPLVEY